MEFEQAHSPKPSQPQQVDTAAPKPKEKGAILAKRLDRKVEKDENGKVVSLQVRLSRGTNDGVRVADGKHPATRGYIDTFKGKADYTVISADADTCWVHFDTAEQVPEQWAGRTADYVLIVK